MATENPPVNASITFKEGDYLSFREWIQLNIESISWQGKYRKSFEDFWLLFFIDGLNLKQLVERFQYAQSKARIGPLTAWFSWLKEKFICFTFIKRSLSVLELSRQCHLSISEVASVLRNFFVDKFPHMEEELSSIFQMGNMAAVDIHITFEELTRRLVLDGGFGGSHEDEIMPSMEITLYDDWSEFLAHMRKDFFHPQFSFGRIRREATFKNQLKFLQEALMLVMLGTALILVIQLFNSWYEKYLADKISIYEPQFLWVDKALKFKARDEVAGNGFKLNLDDLEHIPKEEVKKVELGQEEERINTESEVVLTSWDQLPRDFDLANQEQSEYEEQSKGVYRDNTYGEKKVYRVMMKSEDPLVMRDAVNKLLTKYQVVQGDKVRPGTMVPGGVYYNLFVPREYMKEFLSQVMDVGESVLYESRTSVGNPPGKNKVFIWIKSI